MMNIINFNNFCNDKCKNELSKKICVDNCKTILNDFFIIIEKYNKKYEFNSINIIRKSDK
jgi:hypothetical protein